MMMRKSQFPLSHFASWSSMLLGMIGFVGTAVVSSSTLAQVCVGGSPAPVYFSDNFDGVVLDPAKWSASTNGYPPPAISVSNGFVQMGQPGTGSLDFPYVTNAASTVFPASGDFSFEFAMQYTSSGTNGNGLLVLGSNNEALLEVWLSSGSLVVRLDGGPYIYLSNPSATHTYRLNVSGVTGSALVDGAVVAGGTLAVRPTKLWFGHPTVGQTAAVGWPGCVGGVVTGRWWTPQVWTTFKVDYIRVTQCAETTCDGIDDNGNHIVDEGCDDDGDDYCDANMTTIGTPPVCPHGGGDCDDSSPYVRPGAPQVCDGVNNDCNDLSWPQVPADETLDSDGDGLTDCEETRGVVAKADGIEHVLDMMHLDDVPTDPLTPDIFVEIDYMSCDVDGDGQADPGCNDLHNDAPRPEALNLVEARFLQAPPNWFPKGIRLHLMLGEPVPHTNMTTDFNILDTVAYGGTCAAPCSPDFLALCNRTDRDSFHFGAHAERTLAPPSLCAAALKARYGVSRYVLAGHFGGGNMVGWQGHPLHDACGHSRDLQVFNAGVAKYAEMATAKSTTVPGHLTNTDAEIIDFQAAVLMHELGHTMGLPHGGVSLSVPDGINCKPNYLSVMNYAYMWNKFGLASGLGPAEPDDQPTRLERRIDYSRWSLPTLNETALVESAGLQGPGGSVRTVFGYNRDFPEIHELRIGPSSGRIDWNRDGNYTGTVNENVTWIDDGACGKSFCDNAHDTPCSSDSACGTGGHCVSKETLPGPDDDWKQVRSCYAIPRTPTIAALSVLDASPSGEPTLEQYASSMVGGTDVDGDGVPTFIDSCPLDSNPLQEDADADGYGDPCDCLSADPHNWAIPSEALQVVFSDPSTLQWEPPAFLGADTVTYDTFRSLVPSDFVSSVHCVETNDGNDTIATDADEPVAGQAFYYVIRARSACPNERGPLGTDSQGVPRAGAACD